MKGRRNSKDQQRQALGAQKKLERLLTTEHELEEMLARTRSAAAAILEAAQKDADARIARFESTLKTQTDALRARVEQEHEEAVASVRRASERQVAALEALDETSVAELAEHVLSLLLDESEKAGSS